MIADLIPQAEEMKDEWPLLKAGLFGRSYGRFQEVQKGFLTFAGKASLQSRHGG
jgi:hypothetical protein